MTQATIRWHIVSREDLLDVLLGEFTPQEEGSSVLPVARAKSGALVLGFQSQPSRVENVSPSVVVLDDFQVSDTMSWLRTYAGEAFPISQYARVVLASDWETFGSGSSMLPLDGSRTDSWASVAVGEALSQSDGEAELMHMPLSRVSSCFSLPVARTAIQFGQGEATRVCVDRLRAISSDRRFGRRQLSIDQLLPVWAIAGAPGSERVSPTNAALLVLEAAGSHFRRQHPSAPTIAVSQLSDFPGLSSDSVEERVMAFNRLAMEVLQAEPVHAQTLEAMGPTIAAAAFLVGRSTSHAFLMRRLSRVVPTAMTWFGVIAGLAGPRSWDAAWLRAVKGAERLLRPEFSWADVPTADIGWPEFAWLATTFDEVEQLAALPKMLPRTLGIEIVPGASLQVRLGSAPAETEPRTSQEPTARERALQDTLAQFVSLSQKAQALLSNSASTSVPGKTPMTRNEPPNSTRSSRAKKPKKEQ